MSMIQAAQSTTLESRVAEQADRNERNKKECSKYLSLVWSIIHLSSSSCTPREDLFNLSLLSHFFPVLTDLLSVFLSISVCQRLTFKPLSSVAAHAWHHIHFLDASQDVCKWCNRAWRKRARRSGSKWSRAPKPPTWPLYHHYNHSFFSTPNDWAQGQGTWFHGEAWTCEMMGR